MNYNDSIRILDEIKKAKKILINCHRGPDADSIGSAVAMRRVLEKMGKEVTIICPTMILTKRDSIKGSDNIGKVDFKDYDFSKHDLFLILDSSNWSMVSGSEDIKKPEIPMIVIDHHFSNAGFGNINLIDVGVTSTSEMLYEIFKDWGVDIDQVSAEALLTGIIGDTGVFQYKGVGKKTLNIAGELIEKGADKDKIIQNNFRNTDFQEVKLWGKMIEFMEFDKKNKFVWAAIPYMTFKEYGEQPYAKEGAANLFFPIISGSDFGIIMVETRKDNLSVSFRARDDFDVSQIASELGGGGHKSAAGVTMEGIHFNVAVEKVLKASRKHVKNNPKGS